MSGQGQPNLGARYLHTLPVHQGTGLRHLVCGRWRGVGTSLVVQKLQILPCCWIAGSNTPLEAAAMASAVPSSETNSGGASFGVAAPVPAHRVSAEQAEHGLQPVHLGQRGCQGRLGTCRVTPMVKDHRGGRTPWPTPCHCNGAACAFCRTRQATSGTAAAISIRRRQVSEPCRGATTA